MTTGVEKHIDHRIKRGIVTPSLKDIENDELTKLANKHWAESVASKVSPKIIKDLYEKHLSTRNTSASMLLDLSCYLENYLWPNYKPDSKKKTAFEHTMSIVFMVNEKSREGLTPWECFNDDPDKFAKFLQNVIEIRYSHNDKLSISERIGYIQFLIQLNQSLENEIIRKTFLKLVSLPLWFSLNPGRLQKELKEQPHLRKRLKKIIKNEKKNPPKGNQPEKSFIPNLIQEFIDTVKTISSKDEIPREETLFCERFVEFLIDLISQLPTRTFLHPVLEDYHVFVECKLSQLYQKREEGKLFKKLLDMFDFYMGFEVNNFTGEALTRKDMVNAFSNQILDLQRMSFKHFPQLKDLALSNLERLSSREALENAITHLSDSELRRLCESLKLVGPPPQEGDMEVTESREFLFEIFLNANRKRQSQLDAINEMSLYPDEKVLWDEDLVPNINYIGQEPLALPKLNLQFLTIHDYLLRNFNLYRLESTYQIRLDVQDVIRRVNYCKGEHGHGTFKGWARMGLPITNFEIRIVGQPKLGDTKPAYVHGDVTIDLNNVRGIVREEWDSLKRHDVLFLVTLEPILKKGEIPDESLPFPKRYGVKYIRGCEVMAVKDRHGNEYTGIEEDVELEGDRRFLRVSLDAAQYHYDMSEAVRKQTDDDPYQTFNLLIRRKPQENNFKAVLETIRSLMNTHAVVPDWLHDTFLGYGDPAAACLEDSRYRTIDFYDTFVDSNHVKEAFPDRDVVFIKSEDKTATPPFKITFPEIPEKDAEQEQEEHEVKKQEQEEQPMEDGTERTQVLVEPYTPEDHTPFPIDRTFNPVRFTPVQVEAILRGMNPGLSMIVGPPGTGKTDIAVQIISNLYHNFPEQRILVVTHSNMALNDIFEKIMQRDVNESHLIRLGHGEELLETQKDFSRSGRVNHMLEIRLQLLQQVSMLAESLDLSTDVAYTCETAGFFYISEVISRIEEFKRKCSENSSSDVVKNNFPFKKFFSSISNLFSGTDFETDMRNAEKCFEHLEMLFKRVQECRALELLKTPGDRSNYLLTNHAKVVAMTCTHAALKRGDLVEQGFEFDTLIMEEAAQILEIETFIPMLLQNPNLGRARLKRVVLIGDHHQLPPVVKNVAFQKYSHLDQSLYTRLVRLGVPNVQLDVQGRMRASLAELYRWRYEGLGDLPSISRNEEFLRANTGFCYEYQLVNVEDYEGFGEIEPNPHFYQNLGEAEYVVAVYQYMRLLGYPAEHISLLTTYNGQKHLLRDVVKQRCANKPWYGWPRKVETVDRYQGQQNDYVLLSLVRTKTAGHIRDVRRLVVALSRARLGLIVFCRQSLFENCYELRPALSQFLERPNKLQLIPDEKFPTQRSLEDRGQNDSVQEIADVVEMGQLVQRMSVAQNETNNSNMTTENSK